MRVQPHFMRGRLVKGKGKKGEGNVPLFPSPGREGNQPQGEEGEGKIQGDPLYSPQKIKDLTKNKDFNFQN